MSTFSVQPTVNSQHNHTYTFYPPIT